MRLVHRLWVSRRRRGRDDRASLTQGVAPSCAAWASLPPSPCTSLPSRRPSPSPPSPPRPSPPHQESRRRHHRLQEHRRCRGGHRNRCIVGPLTARRWQPRHCELDLDVARGATTAPSTFRADLHTSHYPATGRPRADSGTGHIRKRARAARRAVCRAARRAPNGVHTSRGGARHGCEQRRPHQPASSSALRCAVETPSDSRRGRWQSCPRHRRHRHRYRHHRRHRHQPYASASRREEGRAAHSRRGAARVGRHAHTLGWAGDTRRVRGV